MYNTTGFGCSAPTVQGLVGNVETVTPDIRGQLDRLNIVIELIEKNVERTGARMSPVLDDGPKPQATSCAELNQHVPARTALGREIQSKAEKLGQINGTLEAILSDLSL